MDESIWQATTPQLDLPALREDITVDTAIVGGGITGLTTALELTQAGQRVAVLEAGSIGSGTTGHSTGNLYAVVGTPLSKLRRKWGERILREVVGSRASAVDHVEGLVREHAIACDFARRSWHLFDPSPSSPGSTFLEMEQVAAVQAALPASLSARAPIGFETGQTLVIDGQAQFNPLQYVRGLASAAASPRCRIFENTAVTKVDTDRCTLHTAGGRVTAASIVMATHTP
ncbi:MAG: NAD(P)/FAD-dependent oxidoreductase, partial [Gammaproteobacteria bacterium]